MAESIALGTNMMTLSNGMSKKMSSIEIRLSKPNEAAERVLSENPIAEEIPTAALSDNTIQKSGTRKDGRATNAKKKKAAGRKTKK